MSQALKEKIERLFEDLKNLKSLEEIKPYCEEFNQFVNSLNYSKSTIGTQFSRYGFYKKFKSIKLEQGKNAESVPKHDAQGNIVGNELKHYAILLSGLNKQDWTERNETTRVTERLSNLDSEGNNGIEIKPTEYIDVTAKLLESDDPHEIAVGLIAATGRRPHEILARAKFTQVEGQAYKVQFKGQGKKRGQEPIFEIDTLFPAAYIIERLKILRRDTQSLIKEVANAYPSDIPAQNKAIEDKRGNSLRRVVQEFFGGRESEKPLLAFRLDKDQNDCKALRAACAALITDRECNGSIGAKMLFAARFLGHIIPGEKPNDRDLQHIATTIGYLDYFVGETVDYPAAPEKIKVGNVKVTLGDLGRIKNLQEIWKCTQHEAIERLLNQNEEIETLRKQLLEAQTKINQITQKNEPKEIMKPTKNIDWESVPTEDLKGQKSAEATEEKLNRAYLAIAQHNDNAPENNQRWYIGNTGLRELTGCNGLTVKQWIDNHQNLVDDHNNKYGLGLYHNKKHKGISIREAIKF